MPAATLEAPPEDAAEIIEKASGEELDAVQPDEKAAPQSEPAEPDWFSDPLRARAEQIGMSEEDARERGSPEALERWFTDRDKLLLQWNTPRTPAVAPVEPARPQQPAATQAQDGDDDLKPALDDRGNFARFVAEQIKAEGIDDPELIEVFKKVSDSLLAQVNKLADHSYRQIEAMRREVGGKLVPHVNDWHAERVEAQTSVLNSAVDKYFSNPEWQDVYGKTPPTKRMAAKDESPATKAVQNTTNTAVDILRREAEAEGRLVRIPTTVEGWTALLERGHRVAQEHEINKRAKAMHGKDREAHRRKFTSPPAGTIRDDKPAPRTPAERKARQAELDAAAIARYAP